MINSKQANTKSQYEKIKDAILNNDIVKFNQLIAAEEFKQIEHSNSNIFNFAISNGRLNMASKLLQSGIEYNEEAFKLMTLINIPGIVQHYSIDYITNMVHATKSMVDEAQTIIFDNKSYAKLIKALSISINQLDKVFRDNNNFFEIATAEGVNLREQKNNALQRIGDIEKVFVTLKEDYANLCSSLPLAEITPQEYMCLAKHSSLNVLPKDIIEQSLFNFLFKTTISACKNFYQEWNEFEAGSQGVNSIGETLEAHETF